MSDRPDWVEQARQVLSGLGATLGDTLRDEAARADGPPAAHADDCRWCPVCQAAAVVRGERPEVTAALADLAAAAATALRAFAEAGADSAAPAAERAAGQPEGGEPEGDVPAGEVPAAPGPLVQRIEIG
jgi:hypothetical protein